MRFIMLAVLCFAVPGLSAAADREMPNPNIISAGDKQSEPHIPEVKFFQKEAPGTFQGRVEQMLHGVYVDIPPEYDHYGYEMRRYMKSVGNFDVYRDRERLAQELRNVENAKIVFRYWRKALHQEMEDVEKIIEEKDSSSNIRSTYKYNVGIINAFMIEVQGWLDRNHDLLKFLSENEHAYKMAEDETLEFISYREKSAFISLFEARNRAHGRIVKYDPFKLMVY